ncbi:MAG: hypothetical protein J0I01_11190 [Stenotrophomonas nitritireducens]|uniref:hypothetical protein n=1 Tax=Stenotrophomonas nitritireducens TaxID=83617 RepID=UPI001AD2806E|nr:hypothetical protein [Stenotrophomonas nitritireducens]MBN8792783.1 hypothetical protein [Stenotrophomonas nitritireducens]MBN8796377.1 hypothetical protein [Stenotrophomonas nitritireducens]
MQDSRGREPLSHRIGAALATTAVLCLFARVLWQVPEVETDGRAQRLQVRWLPRQHDEAQLPPPTAVMRETPVASRDTAPSSPELRPPPSTVATPPSAIAPAASADWSQRLYDSHGEIALPQDIASDGRTRATGERVFEHRDELATGVGERATAGLFSKRAAGTRQSRKEKWLYGEDIQPAEARRPPDVAFNPSLHERASDLGSEATGDAYKAAPIRHEPLPGLDGEASRRLRAAIGELERRYPRCSGELRSRWSATALQHLDALERLEYRYRHGADPVEAEHTLPSAADSAYDLARRALWDAERRMKTCG